MRSQQPLEKEMDITIDIEPFALGAIHKRRLLKRGGMGVNNVGIYLVKRRQTGRGVIKSEKWADVVYGWPRMQLCINHKNLNTIEEVTFILFVTLNHQTINLIFTKIFY